MQRHMHSSSRHLRALRRNIATSPPPRRPWRTALFAVLAGAVLLAAGRFVWQIGPVAIPDTVAVRHGTVEVSVEADALVVRSERVYTAPAAGSVRRLAQEGQRVRVGTPVVTLSPGGDVATQTSGLVSYQVDGLEAALNPLELEKWQPGWYKTLPGPDLRSVPDGSAAQGQPLFKVADNISQALLTLVNLQGLPPFEEGARVAIKFPGHGGATVEGRIARLRREGKEGLLYLTASLFPEGLGGVRKARVVLVFDSFTGNVVPRSAIDVRGGLQGVWVLEATRPVFLPGKVVGGSAGEVILEAAIPPGAKVVRIAPSHMD